MSLTKRKNIKVILEDKLPKLHITMLEENLFYLLFFYQNHCNTDFSIIEIY